jgi:hypothetical protein
MNTKVFVAAAVALAVFPTQSIHAQQQDSVRIAELERRLEAVSRELERLSLGRDVVEADTSVYGLGPAASKVYRVNQGVSIGGYGEVLYENHAAERQDGSASGIRDRMDALRAIVYFGYKFNDRLLLNSEIEIEHADEAFLEFAYLEYKLTDHIGIRGGLLLAPLGMVNELHEPPVFLGTERTLTENRIIPTTWRENGIGFFGGTDQISWRAYLMGSFDGAGFNGSGLRGGRQKGSKAVAENIGVAGRLDYLGIRGLMVGASAFSGATGQGRELDGDEVDGRVTIWDIHGDYDGGGWDLRAVVAGAHVSDVDELNRLNGLLGSDGIGEQMLGWYVETGYDLLRGTDTPQALLPYVRYEKVDTQRSVAPNYSTDPVNDRSALVFGLAWKPVPQVVAKLDYQIHKNEADLGVNQWNVQLGWLF